MSFRTWAFSSLISDLSRAWVWEERGGGRVGGEEGGEEGGRQRRVLKRTQKLPATPAMILVATQVIGLLATSDFSWSSAAQSSLEVFDTVSGLRFFILGDSAPCLLPSFYAEYVFFMFVPLSIVLLALVLVVVARVVGLLPGSLSVWAMCDAVLFGLAPVIYIPVARAAFVLLDCTQLPNGDWVVDSNPGVACFDDRWWTVAPIGLGVVGVFVLGVPAYFLTSLIRNRLQLEDPSVFVRYGPLYKLYRLSFYWGGVLDLGKRLAIVVVGVFLSEYVLLQLASFFAVFMTSLYLVQRHGPFFDLLLNSVDIQLSLVLLVLVLLGVGFHAERGTKDGTSTNTVLTVATLVTLGALAIVAIRAVVVETLSIFASRSGTYSAGGKRARNLAHAIRLEQRDMDIGVGREAELFVQVLEMDRRTGRVNPTPPTHDDAADDAAHSARSRR